MDVLLSDSDWDSYSETDSNENQEGSDYFYGGHASSLFSSLEASIGKIDDFLSFERGFIYGDIVCSVRDPSGQMGKVVGIKISVDLESVNGNVIKNVDSKNLSKIRPISVGDFVVCGPWLGRVDRVADCVAIVFDDGTEGMVTVVDPEKLVPVSPNLLEDPQYPYYPGQRVQVKLSTVSKPTRWLCGNWRESQDEGTVCSLEGGVVYVDWLASVLVGCDSNFPPPPHQLDSKKLTLVSCFSHANWQLGDWCMLAIAETEGFWEAFNRTSTYELTNKQENSERGFKSRNPKSKIEEIFVISKTKTKVDVLWQDGSQSLEVDSQTLVPVSVVNDHEFWPEQFVLEKGTYNLFSNQRWGVVRGVDAKERTVKVEWKTISASGANNLKGEQMEEVVSAYELVEHPDYSYCFGDYVFRMVQNQFDEQLDRICLSTGFDMTEEVAPEEKNFGADHETFTDKSYLPCIGNVLRFVDGAVEVRWATGITSKVAPCEIFRFDKHEGSAAITVGEDTEELNIKTIPHEKELGNEKEKDSLNLDNIAKGCKQHTSESSSCFLPQAAIGFFSSIVGSIFGSHGYSSLSSPSPSGCTSEVEKESGIYHEKKIVETRDICTEPRSMSESDVSGNENLNDEGEDIEGNIYLSYLKDEESADRFRQFDMISDCADHHFHGVSKELPLSQVKKSWMKKVQQEWSILEKDLPEQIYVRAFEERMDLLRAAIVGAPGTPYHDGLFFFDIYLPPEYPHEPPTVHYISGGLRVNPNLYESGKVCLSLLNTWTGTGNEVWNPGSSTILQVLLSLQALVLNDRPYFNEAGYDQQVGRTEGEKNSVSYNENVLLMTFKTMLYSLQKPPMHFEGLVMEHFTQRSENILMACKAYMEGVPIGCAVDFQKTDDKHSEGSSTGFKIMLAKLFQKLVESFSAKGIDCSQFIGPGK